MSTISRLKSFCIAVGAVALSALSGTARAEFPERPITLVVPYGAGSAIDSVARSLAMGAQRHLGQTIVVDNRTGAGGAIGTQYVGNRPADGYTLAMVGTIPMPLSYFSKTLTLHPANDFTHIITTTGYLMAVAVRSDSKIRDIKELVEAARQNPDKMTYSTSGIASTGFLNMAEFAALSGIKVVHVPYKSGAEAVTGLLFGQVDFYSDAAWAPFHKDGRLRPLLIFANQRSSRFPDIPVPTDLVNAKVQPGGLMLVGPKGLPPAVLQKLHDAFKTAMGEPEYKATVERFNLESTYLGPEATRNATAASLEPLRKMFDTLGLGKQ